MQPSNSKVIIGLQGITASAAGTATCSFDTLGYDAVSLCLIAGTSDGSSTAENPTVLTLSETDDTNLAATNFTNISGCVGDTDFTIPVMYTSTTNDYTVLFNVDLRARKRFLKLSVSPTTTIAFTAISHLFRGDEAPITAAKAGADALVEV